MKLKHILIAPALALVAFAACDGGEDPRFPPPPEYDMSGFARGADVSWLTEMEHGGVKFYDESGSEKECMALLRDVGMNSIRLRVWVDPDGGWCNKGDVLAKAFRAGALGMRLMIDFHYSDWWADPGQQNKPAAWTDMTLPELQNAVAAHTKDVLGTLKANGITPEWVQVGNETRNGMLWSADPDDVENTGRADVSMANYAKLNNAGYDAVKEVFPEAKVIVHLDSGSNNPLYRWLFDGLKNNGGKWDVIGMSLYPDPSDPKGLNDACMANIRDMISRHGSEVMICEVGMEWDAPAAAKEFLTDLIAKAKAVEGGKCLGVFYWEPQCHNGWKGYGKGAFDADGRPTEALDAFKK
jgi:arabinogalactan endo-1,4-beta-galactosidase